jgi:GNAT superfamily N-acetyltransferase
MKIQRSTISDESQFHEFWTAALAYQQSVKSQLWPEYPEALIRNEIEAGLHFSAFLPDGALLGYFSLALADPLIWEGKEQGDAIYIHRMCVNPASKGHNFAGTVFIWASGYATGSGRKFLRMDTWADNERLINYYVSCGFQHIGNRQLGLVPELPPHYSHARLALFENEI